MSEGYVRVERHGAVAVIEIDHPPVNALAHAVREPLHAAIVALDADATVRALVIHGVGRNFIAGADVREFDGPPKAPILNDVLLRLEACTKPVIAALHGAALGGGAELALASHWRAASRDLSFGFPEIKLGLLPGAGGTVRLPRVVGLSTALAMMTAGDPIDFARARELGIVDHELTGEAKQAAIAYANELLAAGVGPRRLRERALADADAGEAGVATCAAFRATLSKAAKRLPAAERIVEAVEAAATRPFADALAHARTLFEACRASRESQALRHLFFAERGGAGDKDATPRSVAKVGVIGAGTMGSGIAISLAQAGYAVTLVDTKPEAVAAGLAKVHAAFAASAKKGRMTAEAAAAAGARVGTATELAALADADLVIEAVFENLAVKQQLFAELGRVCRADAVLASNTSTLDVDAIAAPSGRAGDVVGMHFFSPANVMRLVEIVKARETSATALATVAAVTRKLGKIGVQVGNGFGFVGNRMLYAYGNEKEQMLLEGASAAQIDRALEDFGMAMGPNAVGDLAGLDIGWNVRKQWRDKPADPRFYRPSDLLAEHGLYGQKTGRGFYTYVDGRREPNPQAEALIRAEAARLGVAQRSVTDAEIVERCIGALAAEGTRILADGIARSAADIDVVWCNGYGFPRFRGGPMFHAGITDRS